MNLLPIATLDSAPEGSRETLAAVKKSYGFVPNLLGGLAQSPAALHAYLALAEQFGKSGLSAGEQQVVSLTVSRENECGYCMAAHSVLAGKALPAEVIAALRAGQSTGDARLDAVATLARKVVDNRGWLTEGDIADFLAAGFSRANVLDLLVGVSQKTLSNYANHVMGTPLDAVFEGARWSKDA